MVDRCILNGEMVAAGASRRKTVGLDLGGAEVRDEEVVRVHDVAGWDGAPQRSQHKEDRAAKTRQYNSESKVPQYVP